MNICELPGEYAEVKKQADEVATHAEETASDADDLAVLDPRLATMLRESGLGDLVVPQAYGGRYERVDPVAVCVVREAFMSRSAHLDGIFSMQGIGSYALGRAGGAELRKRWLPGIVDVTVVPALALSEPSVGSDLKNIKTELIARDGGLLLRGAKSYISNAGEAHVYTVLAREGDGYSLVSLPADAPGLRVTSGPDLFAPAVLGSLEFDDVELTDADRVGAPGEGFEQVFATLSVFRVSIAGAAVGLAQGVLDEATTHAMNRVAFGRPLARNGVIGQLLADSWTELEMARLLTYRAAELARDHPGGQTVPYSSMAKVGATEMAGRVVDRCVQVMGRFGLEKHTRIGRMYRHARTMRIAEGASEVLRLGIAKQLCVEVAERSTAPRPA